MIKYGQSLLLFLVFTAYTYAQTESGNIKWVIPLSEGFEPMGTPSQTRLGIKENNQVFLVDSKGDKQQIAYDSISHENGAFWKIWQGQLQGILHLERGELIPPVYDYVIPVSKSESNWAFRVNKYGMTTICNEDNKLVLPWAKGYNKLKIIGDSILEYAAREYYHVSKNGLSVPSKVARLQKAPDFQRISSQQFVYETQVNGTIYKDTFEAVESFVGSIAPVKKNKLWGYFHKDGYWLIQPRFQGAFPPDEIGQAVIKEKDKYGVVRMDGTYLIEPTFHFIKPLLSGYFEYKENGLIGVLDSLGKTILSPGEYGRISAAGTECFSIKSGDSLLIIRRDGQPIPLKGVSWCSDKVFGPEFMVAQRQGQGQSNKVKRGLISPNGNWIIPPVLTGRFTETTYFVETEARADPCCIIGKLNFEQNQANKYLVFDKQGDPLLTIPVESTYHRYGDRFIIFKQEDKFGLVATQKDKLAAEYDELKSMGNGWVYARKGKLKGILKWVE